MVASRVGGKATSFCQSAGRYHRLMGSSTSSAISHPAARSASSEKKRSRRGEPPPRRKPKTGTSNCERPNSVLVTAPADAYAARSHQRAAAAWEAGRFADEVVAVAVPQKKGDPVVFARDEGFRPDASMDTLGRLKPLT